MPRTTRTDDQWRRIEPLLPGRCGTTGRPALDNRAGVEGMLWIIRTGAPWRDLPEAFGKWITVYQRLRRWTKRGLFRRLLNELHAVADLRSVQVDGTYVKAHQHATGTRREGNFPEVSRNRHALGRSSGGLTTNLMALADHKGRLIRFRLLPGNAAEISSLKPLLEDIRAEELLTDRAYDSMKVRRELESAASWWLECHA